MVNNMTTEDREEIINAAVERALLLIPEVIGNMMVQHATLAKINKKLLADHPEFIGHGDAVKSVVEMVEGKDPLAKYEDILKKAIPKIGARIKALKNINIDTISANPERQFESIESPSDDSCGII